MKTIITAIDNPKIYKELTNNKNIKYSRISNINIIKNKIIRNRII